MHTLIIVFILQVPRLLIMMLTFPVISLCCPIPTGCSNLPNITQYAKHSSTLDPFQLFLNISTTRGHTFRPQAFQSTLYLENMMNTAHHAANGCSGIFNFTSSSAGVDTPCPWTYQCDYNPQRIPAFIFHAHCESSTPEGEEGRPGRICGKVYYPVPYMTTTSCAPLGEELDSEWTLETGIFPVACNIQDITI